MTKFSECIHFGELNSTTFGNLPLYLPAKQGGFCLHYNKPDEAEISRLIENITLSIISSLPSGLAQVDIFDFRNRKAFPYLSELKKHKLYSVALNTRAANDLFNQLEELIQHRYHELFIGETNLDQYNERAYRKENYHIVIFNLDDFPDNQISPRRVQAFFESAFNAGIYVIAFTQKEIITNSQQQHSKAAFIDILPAISFENNLWAMPEQTFPLKDFLDADFRLKMLDINQHSILNRLNNELTEKQEFEEQPDFLRVPIGKRENGEPAYFTLGAKSGCVSGLLIGATGTGKSTLMNNLVVQIGKHYNAKEIILYLMDYKQGNEFKIFKDHPNVKYLFENVNAQSGVQLLQELEREHNARAALFNQNGKDIETKDIDTFNQKYPEQRIPHILLIVDEFQMMFGRGYEEETKVNALLNMIARQGRSTGIHLLLSTQSMQGVPLDQSTRQQFGLRIAYRVDESALFNIINDKYRNTITSLKKYQALFQYGDHANLVFVDKPLNIIQSIEEMRDSRPADLCITPEYFAPQAIKQEKSFLPFEQKEISTPSKNLSIKESEEDLLALEYLKQMTKKESKNDL